VQLALWPSLAHANIAHVAEGSRRGELGCAVYCWLGATSIRSAGYACGVAVAIRPRSQSKSASSYGGKPMTPPSRSSLSQRPPDPRHAV